MNPATTAAARALALLALTAGLQAASAEDAYPAKPVQMILPFPAGAPVDALARRFAQALDRQLGQRVVVMNRDGGSTTIAMNSLVAAPADGYTLVYGPVTALTVHPHWMKGLQYRPENFVPVCQTFENIFVLAAGPGSSIKDFASAIAQGKARPGSLTYAHPGVASSPHLAGAELFQHLGVQATDVPYRGEAAMLTQLRSHEVDLGVLTTGFTLTQSMKPLAVFANQRLASFPDTPTVKELGIPVSPSGYGGLFARTETPAPILARIEEACKGAVADPEFKDMAQRQYQQADYLNRAQFTARLQADAKSKGELLKTVKLDR